MSSHAADELTTGDGDELGEWLLKRTVDGLLPSDIVRRKKQAFGAPVAEWLRGDLGIRVQREIRGSSLAERGLDYARIDELWDAHRSGRADWSFQPWNLYNVSAWHHPRVAGRG